MLIRPRSRCRHALIENATRAWDMACSSIPFDTGDTIITGVNEYASNYLAFLPMRAQRGVEIVVCPDDSSGQFDVEALGWLCTSSTKLIALQRAAPAIRRPARGNLGRHEPLPAHRRRPPLRELGELRRRPYRSGRGHALRDGDRPRCHRAAHRSPVHTASRRPHHDPGHHRQRQGSSAVGHRHLHTTECRPHRSRLNSDDEIDQMAAALIEIVGGS